METEESEDQEESASTQGIEEDKDEEESGEGDVISLGIGQRVSAR